MASYQLVRLAARRNRAQSDDESTADDLVAATSRGSQPRRHRDRVAHRRRPDPPLHVSRRPRPCTPPGPRPGASRSASGRSRRHARVERLSPLRALLRGLRHGRGDPHHQSAPVPRPDHVHCQSRRGLLLLLRPDVRAAHRAARSGMQERQRMGRDDRSRAHAGRCAPQPALLRRAARCRERRFRLARVRREHRGRAVLHVRHHGQSQGRAVQPSLDAAARLRDLAA